ncbi:unnamed protein product, partial [Rangifer tarandus platyrhynchus]
MNFKILEVFKTSASFTGGKQYKVSSAVLSPSQCSGEVSQRPKDKSTYFCVAGEDVGLGPRTEVGVGRRGSAVFSVSLLPASLDPTARRQPPGGFLWWRHILPSYVDPA